MFTLPCRNQDYMYKQTYMPFYICTYVTTHVLTLPPLINLKERCINFCSTHFQILARKFQNTGKKLKNCDTLFDRLRFIANVYFTG